MNYDTMSVHELLEQFHVGCSREIIDEVELSAIESSLRKAVIREASVRVLHIKTKETGRNEYGVWTECEVNGTNQSRESILRTLPDGDYAIVAIPKETK